MKFVFRSESFKMKFSIIIFWLQFGDWMPHKEYLSKKLSHIGF